MEEQTIRRRSKRPNSDRLSALIERDCQQPRLNLSPVEDTTETNEEEKILNASFSEFDLNMNKKYVSKQQQQIVESQSKYKLINGCAGSRKTDTLILSAIEHIKLNHQPILFITLVSSVTVEIKSRLEDYLNIKLDKIGVSNHYVGFYQDVPIGINIYFFCF